MAQLAQQRLTEQLKLMGDSLGQLAGAGVTLEAAAAAHDVALSALGADVSDDEDADADDDLAYHAPELGAIFLQHVMRSKSHTCLYGKVDRTGVGAWRKHERGYPAVTGVQRVSREPGRAPGLSAGSFGPSPGGDAAAAAAAAGGPSPGSDGQGDCLHLHPDYPLEKMCKGATQSSPPVLQALRLWPLTGGKPLDHMASLLVKGLM